MISQTTLVLLSFAAGIPYERIAHATTTSLRDPETGQTIRLDQLDFARLSKPKAVAIATLLEQERARLDRVNHGQGRDRR